MLGLQNIRDHAIHCDWIHVLVIFVGAYTVLFGWNWLISVGDVSVSI